MYTKHQTFHIRASRWLRYKRAGL